MSSDPVLYDCLFKIWPLEVRLLTKTRCQDLGISPPFKLSFAW